MTNIQNPQDHIHLEFHAHTIYSKDSLTTPQKLIAACRKKGIDKIIITDHNTIAGARAAQELAPDLVIIGEEIMTTEGEILAAFVTQEIPKGLPAQEVIRQLREQGAFISVSHPFDVLRSGHWGRAALLDVAAEVDAIETFNARCLLPKYNAQAQSFADEFGLLATVGSDAHTAFELGSAILHLPNFTTPDELRQSLRDAHPHLNRAAPWVRVFSRYAVLRKKIRPIDFRSSL